MYLATNRLLLRPVEYTDIDQLVAVWTDPEVTRWVGGPRDREQLRAQLDEEADDPRSGPFGMWPLIEKTSAAVVGSCSLLADDAHGVQQAELSCVISQQAWGRGFATEAGAALMRFAFDVLALDRVVALVDPSNLAAIRVAEKLGMHREPLHAATGEPARELWVANTDN